MMQERSRARAASCRSAPCCTRSGPLRDKDDRWQKQGQCGSAEPTRSPSVLGYLTEGTYKMRNRRYKMKYIATMALMLNLGVASVYAQHQTVKMAVSGTSASS